MRPRPRRCPGTTGVMPMVHATPRLRALTVLALLAALSSGCIPTGPDPADPSPWAARSAPEPGVTGAGGSVPPSMRAGAAPPSASAPTRPATSAALACPDYDDGHDLSYVALDSHRFASVCTGMTFEQASAALPGVTIRGEEQCPWVGVIVDADPLSIQAVTDPKDALGGIRFFRMLYLDDPATAPPHEVPATAEGVSIGSARTDVTAAYPTATSVVLDDPSRGRRDQLVVEEAPAHWYVFDLVDDVVAEVTWGTGLEHGIAWDLCAR